MLHRIKPDLARLARALEITTELTVERRHWTRKGRAGLGYCEDQGQYMLLVKRWKWRGTTLWRRVIDREDIPAHVWISWGALGYDSSGWESSLLKRLKASG